MSYRVLYSGNFDLNTPSVLHDFSFAQAAYNSFNSIIKTGRCINCVHLAEDIPFTSQLVRGTTHVFSEMNGLFFFFTSCFLFQMDSCPGCGIDYPLYYLSYSSAIYSNSTMQSLCTGYRSKNIARSGRLLIFFVSFRIMKRNMCRKEEIYNHITPQLTQKLQTSLFSSKIFLFDKRITYAEVNIRLKALVIYFSAAGYANSTSIL